MKIRDKLITGFVLVTLIMGVFSFYMFEKVTKSITDKEHEINERSDLVVVALSFSEENYHTQLEIWEYAFQPTEKRLDAFNKHKKEWDIRFTNLMTSADKIELTSSDKLIIDDLKAKKLDIETTWKDTIDYSAKIATTPAGNYSTLTYPMFDPLSVDYNNAELRQTMFVGEKVFDDSQFNKKVEALVKSQRAVLAEKMKESQELNDSVQKQFMVMFGIVFLVAIGIALFFTYIIAAPIKKLSDVANKIAKGEMNVQMPEIKTNDEIKDLSEAIKGVLAAEEFLIEETKKNEVKDNKKGGK